MGIIEQRNDDGATLVIGFLDEKAMMASIDLTWQRLRGRCCDTCAYVDVFRSNGDGQVTRLHTFCRAPQGPHCDRPAPPARTCPAWQKADHPRQSPTVGDPNLTA